jgi:polysaccharide deacetylase family protein (PEP-CTERM system associated)
LCQLLGTLAFPLTDFPLRLNGEDSRVLNATATLQAQPLQMRPETEPSAALRIILSFDIEEHFRIEAAAGLTLDAIQKTHYRDRLDASTNWLLDLLDEAQAQATFFIVGEIAEHNPALIRRIARAGHEVASHGWDHRRVHHFTPATFREDIRKSKEALEDLSGEAVVGYRAPTFSITQETAWALDVLADLGMMYDSSIYPVHHDRYGVPAAPRSPFLAQGLRQTLLELPPMTLRLAAMNFPMGGGGYFRLFPLFLTEWALRQTERTCLPAIANLYFHPWEFDPEQQRLPLKRLSRLRTYVGIRRSRARLAALLTRYRFCRAVDVAKQLDPLLGTLPAFTVGA